MKTLLNLLNQTASAFKSILLALLLTFGVGNAWAYSPVYLNGDFATYFEGSANWGDNGNGSETYHINYELDGANSGHYFLPLYTTAGDKYWRFCENNGSKYLNMPAEDNYVLNVGTAAYQVQGGTNKYNFKSTVNAGVIAVHIHQNYDGKSTSANGSDDRPRTWLERPTIYIWHNWNGDTNNWGNNGGDAQEAMTDNNDGTYTYDGLYGGNGVANVGIEGSEAIKKFFADDAVTKYGSLTTGDKCRFTWNSAGYKGYDKETDNRGSLTVTKILTITYDGNGNGGGSAPANQEVLYNTATATYTNTGNMTKTNMAFVGWNTQADGQGDHYDIGAEITLTDDITLYAEWVPCWVFRGGDSGGVNGEDAMGDWTPQEMTIIGTNAFMIELTLAANTTYEFKLCDRHNATLSTPNSFAHYGCNSTMTGTTLDWIFYTDHSNCKLSTGANGAGKWRFAWNASSKSLCVYSPNDAPKAAFANNRYIYFDARDAGNWKNADFNAKFYFKNLATGENDGDITCENTNKLDDWVYYALVPADKTWGSVQMNRLKPEDGTLWNYAAIIYARDRSSANLNSMVAPSTGGDGITLSWGTYCPPMSSVTMADNGTTNWGGNGSSETPYLVPTGGDIKVHVTASASALNDANMTRYFLFKKESSAIGEGSESTEKTITASSTTGTKEAVIVEAYNYYNSTEGTHLPSNEIYYEVRTPYTISYNAGTGGSGSRASETKLEGVDFTLPNSAVFTRTGYTQTGWTTSDGGAQTHALGGTYTSDEAQEFFPVWTANPYTVTLNNLEASTAGTESVNVTYDAITGLTLPIEKPEKAHYDFGGYYVSNDGGETLTTQLIDENGNWKKSISGYTGASGDDPTWVYADDITLYAKWTEHEYAITIAMTGSGSTSPASSTTAKYVTASGDISAIPASGYSFRDWDFSKTDAVNDIYCADTYTSTSNPVHIHAVHDGTLTANFTPNTYTVSFENLGADAGHKGSLDTTVTFNDTIHMKGRIEVPSKTNYDFGGYYISTNKGATLTTQIIDANGNWNKGVSGYTGEKDGVASWVCAADTVLYAKWTEIKHTVAVEVSPAGAGAVQVSGENITKVTNVGVATKSAEMTPVANAGWVFKEWQVSSANLQMDLINYHSNYQKEGTNAMKVNATADEQTLTAVFEPRYYLVGGEIMSGEDGTGTGTTSGMPGWGNYNKPFKVVTTTPVLDTCKLTLTSPNANFFIMVRDKADGLSYGTSSSVSWDSESAVFDTRDVRATFQSNGGTEYTFKITAINGSGRPTVSVERPHQILIGRRRVDIDGDEHDDDLGGTVALSEQTAPDTWTPISNEAWVSYGHSVKYDASPVSGYSLAWYTESDYSSLFTTDSYWFHSASATGKGYAQFTETPTTVTLANDGHGHVEIGSGNTVTQTTVGVTTTRELTAVPNDGYMFSSWNKSGDDIEITSTSTNPTTLSGKGAGAASEQEVRANFTYRWALKAESGNWGSSEFTIANISTDGSGDVIGSVDINLAANTDYQFTIKDKLNEDDIYKIGGTSVLYMKHDNCSNWTFGTGGDRSNCGITTAGKGTYRFSWNPSTHKLSVTYPAAQLISCGAATENGGTGGSITAIKDEANNDYSNGQYISEGNTITFTATPTDGYEFVGWFSNNEYNAAPVTTENPWDFPVAEPVNVYALFAKTNVYYFDGNNGTSTDWTTPTNWTRKVVPTTSSHTVRILKPVTVSTGTKVHVANVDIVTGGSFTPAGGSALTASGQLNIADGGMLIVAGSVKKVADASAMDTKTPTDYDDLNIGSSLANGNGALVIGSHDGTNKAHVAFATKAKKDDAGHNVNQFIGTPFNDENYIFYNYYGTKIYEFKAARDGNKGANNEWQRLPNDGDMTPFWGYNILTSQTTSPTLWMQGTLNSSANHTANLYFKDGDTQTENMLANSWVSPIDITKFQAADFSANVEQTIYIYNAGTVEDEKTAGEGVADASNPGQWIVLPINSMPWTSPTVTVIPSMQAFSVYVTAASQTLTMDYNRLVYNPAVNGTATIVPNRAPRRYTEEEAPAVLKIRVSGESGYSDQIVLLSREDFTFGYDNGWDGRKIMGDDAAPQLYTITQDGKMSIDCTPLIEGTLVGFKPGEADPFYTIRFDYDGDETLYLNDLQMQLSTPIDAEYTYSFSAYANDAESRFVISATPISQTATGIDRTETVSELRKLIIHDHLYIIRQGRIYTAHGQLVK